MMELQAQFDGVTPTRLGAPLFADTWPNTKVARVVAMAARGYSCTSIAAALDDGTTGNHVACMIRNWGVQAPSSDPRKTYADVPVPLAAKFRTTLGEEAQRRGLELPVLMAKMAETICRDGLFSAVLD